MMSALCVCVDTYYINSSTFIAYPEKYYKRSYHNTTDSLSLPPVCFCLFNGFEVLFCSEKVKSESSRTLL